MKRMFRFIAAIDRSLGIAKHGFQPWYLPTDETYFTEQTKSRGGIVLTGGVTFREAYKSQPLADRQNYILTHDRTPIEGATVVNNLDQFLDDFKDQEVWVAGGAAVFTAVMQAGRADELYLTVIDADFGCDQFFPAYDKGFRLAHRGDDQEENGFRFRYEVYEAAPASA